MSTTTEAPSFLAKGIMSYTRTFFLNAAAMVLSRAVKQGIDGALFALYTRFGPCVISALSHMPGLGWVIMWGRRYFQTGPVERASCDVAQSVGPELSSVI